MYKYTSAKSYGRLFFEIIFCTFAAHRNISCNYVISSMWCYKTIQPIYIKIPKHQNKYIKVIYLLNITEIEQI